MRDRRVVIWENPGPLRPSGCAWSAYRGSVDGGIFFTSSPGLGGQLRATRVWVLGAGCWPRPTEAAPRWARHRGQSMQVTRRGPGRDPRQGHYLAASEHLASCCCHRGRLLVRGTGQRARTGWCHWRWVSTCQFDIVRHHPLIQTIYTTSPPSLPAEGRSEPLHSGRRSHLGIRPSDCATRCPLTAGSETS